MATWTDIVMDAPEFAARVRERFEAGTNKTLATIRRDGSPRISGTELEFDDLGRITLGMMPASMKELDVRRDPRVAIHSPTLEPPKDDPAGWLGEAKFAGTLRDIPAPQGSPFPQAPHFELDITEAVLVYVVGDELAVESWHPGRGWTRITRR
ncbi:pyridoxamine 5'-phosphate oxidase family protein [Glaciihabitans sp. dw_435]|uniref:pyridoxamine 5'-phosphate oxidase family protein n=1 Tax=Glaciihabitans sp. dw_435 TaxID=2720081 RepID=UPI001BD44825|nr:pyridoxamine 5'-phosphate oxidase family protein [Glaciihabitans sp. dw_435]